MGFNNHFDIGDDKIFELKQLAESILAEEALPKTNRVKIEPKMPNVRAYMGRATDAKPLASILSLASEIAALTNKTIKANYAAGMAFVTEFVEQVPHSVQVKNFIESYLDAIFRLAIQWKKEYEEFKRKRCLLDFGDLLQKFYELLNKEVVVADIQSRYKVAFVDEFQDCSPLQVKSFERLSELMEQSVWVGDIKQAIYGFRGTNTELIKSIIDKVEQENYGNKLDSLKNCWRSNETIVNLVNNIFCEKVFCGQLKDELIRLGIPNRTENDSPKPQERELQHMHFVCGRKEDIPEALAEKVEQLITDGTFKPNEIAILYRQNSEVIKCANALKERGIAYNARIDREAEEAENSMDAISSFISAVVSFAARGDNELSKAIIANRIEAGYSTSELITNRLQYLEVDGSKKEWLSGLDIIGSISDLRKTIGNQSVSSAIETMIVELNLADLIKRIDPSAPAYNYCSALESKASTYEGICANFGLSSTLVGFVEYLKEHPIEYPGDDNGVSVLTYHKSKGLEWPCVILCSLHKAPIDAKKTFFGVLTYNTEVETKLRLVPAAVKGFGIMDRFENNNFFKEIKRATINEAKRLMYVGITRPKEQLILTTYGTKTGDDRLTSIGCDSIDSHAAAQVINWGGANWKHIVENYVVPEQEDVVNDTIEFTALKQPTEHQSFDEKFISPSKVKTDMKLYSVEQCGSFADRITATAVDGRDSTIGDFFHHLMCLWRGDRSIIEKLAEAYGVKVDVEAVATSIENFWAWMAQTYGKPISTDRELPFSFTNDHEQTITGEIDLVYHTAEGDVMVDYKTYQGSLAHLTNKDSDFYAGKYGGQLALYEEAMSRNGSTICDHLICYLSLGVIIKINSN